MSGVGSTNAMKKGSGNNPFLAFSAADMRSYLNSAYTGCIVKYTGPSTKVEVLTSDRNKDAQHLVFDITKPFTRSSRGFMRYAMKIDKMTDDGVKTTYICHKWINKLTGRLQNGLGSLDESEYWVYSLIEIDDINFDNIKGNNVKFLAVTESLSEIPSLIDLHQDWPTTKGINGWQTNCINEAGKITLWSYSEDVKYSYAGGSSVGPDEMIYYEPYVVNELYKVTYGNGRYYFEEFYYISDDVTTATVEDVAPGKTFYDFTGTKQTGTGTKINPYIAKTLDELKSYLTSAYKDAFVKYIGSTVSDIDDTKYYEDSIYQVVDDGTTLTYVILPTLSNPGTAADLAQGKQLIDGEGKVVEGTAKLSTVDIVTGSILPDTSEVKSIIIAGIPRRPKIIVAYQNGITSSSKVGTIVSDPACANEGATSNLIWVFSGTTTRSTKRYDATFDYDEVNQTVTLNAGTTLSFLRFELPYAIAY